MKQTLVFFDVGLGRQHVLGNLENAFGERHDCCRMGIGDWGLPLCNAVNVPVGIRHSPV